MREIPLSEARKNLSKLVGESIKEEDMAISVRGNQVAVIVPIERYQTYKQALLQEELQPIFDEFDDVFKALADR